MSKRNLKDRLLMSLRPIKLIALLLIFGTLSTAAIAAHAMRGLAAYYGEGQSTASGERFNRHALTAAHRTLPFGTLVRVTRTDTGRSVVVRINDRGPYGGGRIIDVSVAAAQELGMIGRGVAPVSLQVVGRD